MQPAKPNSPDDAAFDFSELLARVDNDRELLVDLVTIFKEEFPRHLQGLREAIDSKDPQRIAAAGHTLKGMLSNLAAGRAARLAAEIEKLGREGRSRDFADLLFQFETESRSLLPQLEAYVSEVHP
jgi:HPt (histidine-containing phosphotransfer) domain-containing protein